MPNHVTNWVEIKGSKSNIAKLKKDVIKVPETVPSVDSIIEFDFNGIIPMPKELEETVSPTDVVDTQAEADEKNKEYSERMKGFGSQEQKIRYISKAEAERRTKKYGGSLRQALNIGGDTNYGTLNWHDWAVLNWGTKWGAYDAEIMYQSPTILVVCFRTAWSSPDPIFEELEKRGLKVNCFWQDEDPSNSGYYGDPYESFDIDMTARVEYIPPISLEDHKQDG